MPEPTDKVTEQATPTAKPRTALVTLIVAVALFMQNLDGTVLSTAIPTMARDFAISPVDLKLALTAYLLALAIFIPASGWVADRFGARNVFCLAMIVFAAGSIACALSQSLAQIVAARVLQGMGGAMMVPVGRLVVLRAVPRSELVSAMSLLSIPALMGPIMGPPVGGLLTTYVSWHWIFWINIPIAAMGVVLAIMFIPDLRAASPPSFDVIGFGLIGPGLSAFLAGLSLLGVEGVDMRVIVATILAGVALIAAYVRYALRRGDALIDLRLLAIPTFFVGIVGGFLFRIGVGATPFMLPLFVQEGLGYAAVQSGLITFISGAGALTMKAIAPRLLQRYGFRRVLVFNGMVACLLVSAPALFAFWAPVGFMLAVLFVGGLTRSLEFTCISSIIFADISEDQLSRASSFAATVQELSGTVGIAIAALVLQFGQRIDGADTLNSNHFVACFLVIGMLAVTSLTMFRRLDEGVGAGLIPGTSKARCKKPGRVHS